MHRDILHEECGVLGVYAPGRMDVAQLVYVVASESCALDAVGAHIVRDIDPGEIVVFGRRACARTGATAAGDRRCACLNTSTLRARTR